MYAKVNEPLWQTVESVISDEGLALYDIERTSPDRLRIFISATGEPSNDDSASKQAGVTSRDCSRICRRLQVVFSVDGNSLGVGEEPGLEVSSPGINRTLRLPQHFSSAVGERVKIILNPENKEILDGQGQIIGTLSSYDDGVLGLVPESKKGAVEIPQDAIKRARIEFTF